MKRTLIIISLAIMSLAATAQTREQRLKDHVYYLASDEMQGRAAGSPDAARAAEYIVEQYSQIGLKPFFDDWYMPFMGQYKNVVAVIEGSDPQLKDEYIVLGAHYDHLGVKNGEVYNGADDNASGTAALIEIARSLVADRADLKRSVIIAAFDAEELGLFGSNALAGQLRDKKIKLMMSIDMVGWLKATQQLTLEGVATIKDGKSFLENEAPRYNLKLKLVNFEKSILTATDTEGFAKQGIPTLAVSTGLKSPYHKPQDDPDLIDYPGMDKVAGYLVAVAEEAASNPSFRGSGRVAGKHTPSKTFQAGITAGIGNSSLHFKDAGFNGNNARSYNVGIYTRIGNTLAIQPSILYQHSSSDIPDPNNLYSAAQTISRQAITVPVELMLQSYQTMGAFIGLGPYYSHVFESELASLQWNDRKNEWGLSYTFGANIGRLGISYRRMAQMGKFFETGGPKAAIRHSMFTVNYRF